MRVMLFCQTGDERPKCVKSFGDRRHNAMNYFNAIRPRFGSLGQPECGWLVECANAEAGRALLAAKPDSDGHCDVCGLVWPDERETLEPHICPPGFGRILASGGRHA